MNFLERHRTYIVFIYTVNKDENENFEKTGEKSYGKV